MINCKVVYGPQGCGKTRNSDVLMRKLGCTSVVDVDAVDDLSTVPADTLVLTNTPVEGALDYYDLMAGECGHGEIRLPYSREFTLCRCGQRPGHVPA